MIRLRPALPEDLPAIEAVYGRAARANAPAAAFLARHPEVLRIDPRCLPAILVAETSAGALAGFARVEPLEPGASELAALFVDPPFWRRGIARRLLSRIVADCRDRGQTRLFVTAAAEGLPFYRARGFTDMGPFETAGGPARRLVLEVDAPSPVPRGEP